MVPVIQEPVIEELPVRQEYVDSGFKAIDNQNFLISEVDLKILSKYIIDLKTYGNSGWTWVDYYIAELNEFKR